MVIADTCALIEACKDTPNFTSKTFKKMEAGLYVLSISFAEIACKMKLGKLEMNITAKDLYKLYIETKNIKLIDIGVDEWIDSIELDWSDNRDPADRVITAFALKNEIPIVTSDKKIKSFYKNVIW